MSYFKKHKISTILIFLWFFFMIYITIIGIKEEYSYHYKYYIWNFCRTIHVCNWSNNHNFNYNRNI